MATNLILNEIAERIRMISSNAGGTVDVWLCDQFLNYIIDVSNTTSVKNGMLVVEAERFAFKFKCEHLIKNDKNYYNQLILFSDSGEEVYRYDPNISVKEKKVEIL